MTPDSVFEFGFKAEHAAVDAGTLKAVLPAGVAPSQGAVSVTDVAVLLATVPVIVTVVVPTVALTVTVAPTYALTAMARPVSVALVSV
jgi:hypothetical protein